MSRSIRPDYETLRERQARAQEALATPAPDKHVREVLAVHEGYGEEAWCPDCREHWPCGPALVQAIHDRKAQA